MQEHLDATWRRWEIRREEQDSWRAGISGHTVASLPELTFNPPEYPLNGRYELAMRWTPDGADRLLDAGCAWGYGTRHFAGNGRQVVGLEPDPVSAELFRTRYPHLEIVESAMEQIPLDGDSFDVILALDSFEHVQDEQRSLAELYRLLKIGGVLIITTPHRGAFAFLDRENLAPRVAALLRRRPRRPHVHHRHYSLGDLRRLLDASPFRGRYEITEVFRSGLLLEALAMDLALALDRVTSSSFAERLLRPLAWLAERDFWIGYGRFSYNIAVRIVKTS